MRLKRFFVSAALLLVSTTAFCCGPYWFPSEEYYMYRVYDKTAGKASSAEWQLNCEAWKRVTSTSVDIRDVKEVVYKYSKEETAGILSRKKSGNSFADWLKANRDSETIDFLVLAKTCEAARFEMNDPWYYPSKNDPTVAILNNVIDKAVSYTGTRLEDRHVLQAIRAMFSLEKYSCIDSLWKSRESRIKDGVIKDMILGYVAGAAYNTGDVQKALDYYTKNNDLESLSLYLSKAGLDSSRKGLLSYAAEHCPDNSQLPELLQGLFYGSEPDWYFYYNYTDIKDTPDYRTRAHLCRVYDKSKTEEYISICLKAAENAQEPGIWYYTAAYLTDLLGQPEKALKIADKAAVSKKSTFIAESVKVLQIYLEAKTSKYDSAYEGKLLSQLKWLDEKIKTNITDEVKRITEGGYYLHVGISYMYWNDMLRRIVISEVCPRMEDAGKSETALALLNMADNRLLSLVGSHEACCYDWKAHEYRYETMSLDKYRHSRFHNMFDFSNYYFIALDGMDLDNVVRYASVLERGGRSPLEQFAIARGFNDMEYIYDLIGTRYLRERKYAKAAAALSKVSSGYQKRLNVNPYCDRDPFKYIFTETGKPFENYKLNFAVEMRDLEKEMASSNPDVCGSAMVRYGIGLRSSFDYCWALTQYHLSEGDPWLYRDFRKDALADAEDYIRKGLSLIYDRELAAKAYLSVCQWQTVAERFTDTEAGNKVITECDKLYDHKLGKNWKLAKDD